MSPGAPVVSTAGPLMALAKLNLLHLLKELYGRVYFARSVYDETVIEGLRQGYEDARTLHLFLDQMEWRPEEVDPADISPDLREAHLDQGERDTLALAEMLDSALVLMDETVGRQTARTRGLAVRGSLGVLVEAYQRGLCLIAPIGMFGNVIRIAPPLVIEEAQMHEGLDILDEAMKAATA